MEDNQDIEWRRDLLQSARTGITMTTSGGSERHDDSGVSAGVIGDYRLVRELGRGGMGKVFLATSPSGDEVALKTVIFPEGLDPRARWETVERFQREARAARSLSHPSICQVLDIGADGDTFFIVLEFLKGKTLRQIVSDDGPVPPIRALEIMRQVCEGLAYAHDQGIIHRDIKPDNIMVLEDGGAKLMDFGLASIVHETGVTQTGTALGTFPYMSPEQARGEKLDARSDIFSLGATFYEVVTGRRAFQGDAPGAIIAEVLGKDPDMSLLPTSLTRIIGRCLRKDPTYRFQSIGELLAGLGAPGAAPASGGTMVLGQTATLPGQPAGAAPASAAPSTPMGSGLVSPEDVKRAMGDAPKGLLCSKCKEKLSETDAVCWRCGTPNPVMASRRHEKKVQKTVEDALRGYQPRKKKGWFRR